MGAAAILCLTFGACGRKVNSQTVNGRALPLLSPTPKKTKFGNREAGIRFEIPESWDARVLTDRIEVASADRGTLVGFITPKEGSWDALVAGTAKELDKIIANNKYDSKPQKELIDGMETLGEQGNGKVEGKDVTWSIKLVNAKRPVFIVAYAVPEEWKKNQLDFDKLISSVKKM